MLPAHSRHVKLRLRHRRDLLLAALPPAATQVCRHVAWSLRARLPALLATVRFEHRLERDIRTAIAGHRPRPGEADAMVQLVLIQCIELLAVHDLGLPGGLDAVDGHGRDADRKRDSMSELGETQEKRMQRVLEHLARVMATLSNLLKRSNDTASDLTRNLK